jgi:hypothetical protein
MADGTTMRERKDALKERYGTRSFKKGEKVRAADEAERDIKMLEMANDPARRAEAAGAMADAMNPGGARGPTQTIDVRSGMTGSAGRTAQAARAAGAGAGTAAQQAAARVQQQAAGQLRERYGLQAQEAARQRVSQGLAKAGEATFAEQLAQGALQGAVQGAIGAGTTVATGGIGQAAGLSADMLRAAQGVS